MDLPEAHRVAPGRHAIHATAVSCSGRGLLILGPSGSGKSSVAAQMIALGATLVSDDRVEILEDGRLAPPPGASALIELRGLGLVACPVAPAPFSASLLLAAPTARLPEPETLDLAGHRVPLLRHAAAPDLGAKLTLWLRALP
ncbi:HPr kinase/phosphorylase [Jannaschia seohaensis]|uniref:HPr kinase/phosphorylase n=1 Tax=Jannaschia seohaensis TaxID=475081 RepID=A0A2Y9AAS8_9RHOB|nr:serine kinase [Jannaschia seohaensis]PWJ20970.1 HPr kinase/phosphorylase [Jannaschia seohaensis]SSA41380.1 HPr kinase/phosphorylase [Jannaschia seohaensis]